MTQRWFRMVSFALVWPLVGLGSPLRDAIAADGPPNVVMIISDDHAWTDYGFMGHPVIETPRLDRLAAESLTFTRGYVPSSLCRPSLATMITGLYPHQHGITGNDPDLPDPKVNPMAGRANPQYARYYETLVRRIEEHPTLPRLLAQRGYVSLQTGKWWEGPASRGGFTEGMTHGDPARGGRHGDAGLRIGREGLEPIFDFVRRAKSEGKPFFVWYAPFMPHSPHTPPKALLEKYSARTNSPAVAQYYAMCEWFDQTCGQLLDFLAAEGLRETTLVVYVADNGWIQDPKQPNRYAPRSKRSPYDGGLRTPIMVHWPGRIEPRRDDASLVGSIDLAPTILTACGLKPTEAMPGVDLLDRRAVEQRQTIFGEVYAHNVADVDVPTKSLQYRWCISGPWKLIVPNRANEPDAVVELFDVVADPLEQTNLADRTPNRVAELHSRLNAWWSGAPVALGRRAE